MADDADINDPRISNSASVLPAKAVNSTPYIDFRTLSAAMKAMGEVKLGSGTAPNPIADVEVALDFDPAAVLLINQTTLAEYTHLSSMAAGTAFERITAGTLSLVGADGITLGAKGERKFTIGSGVLAADDVYHFIAIGTRGPDIA